MRHRPGSGRRRRDRPGGPAGPAHAEVPLPLDLHVRQAALRAARRTGDAAAVADAHRGVGRGQVWLRRFDEAGAHLRQALEQFRDLGDPHGQAHTELDLSLALERQGRFAEAVTHAVESRRHFRAAGERQGEARALGMIGWCRAQVHDYTGAVACCEQALSVFRATGDHASYANTADSLGYAFHRLGRAGEAVAAYRDAISRWHTVGDRYGLAQTLTHLGDVHAHVGSVGDALAAWHDSLAILDELGHPEATRVLDRVTAYRDAATRSSGACPAAAAPARHSGRAGRGGPRTGGGP